MICPGNTSRSHEKHRMEIYRSLTQGYNVSQCNFCTQHINTIYSFYNDLMDENLNSLRMTGRWPLCEQKDQRVRQELDFWYVPILWHEIYLVHLFDSSVWWYLWVLCWNLNHPKKYNKTHHTNKIFSNEFSVVPRQ